jgi:hypothetical protein
MLRKLASRGSSASGFGLAASAEPVALGDGAVGTFATIQLPSFSKTK